MPVVTLGGVCSLAFEIHIIHERVVSERCVGHPVKVRLDARPGVGRCCMEHFRQRIFESHGCEACLFGHGCSQELSERHEPGSIDFRQELAAVVPWRGGQHPIGHGFALRFEIADQSRKTLLERPTPTGRIPDKMSNPERRKFLALVPRCQASYRARAFVAPDSTADRSGLLVGEAAPFGGGSGKRRGRQQNNERKFHGAEASTLSGFSKPGGLKSPVTESGVHTTNA